ncbi:MAG: GvpL/GvpF family gas vesicle protein [Mycobacterium leprae]
MQEAQALELYGIMGAGAASTLAAAGGSGGLFCWIPCGAHLALTRADAVAASEAMPSCRETVLTIAMAAGPVIPAAPGLKFTSVDELCRFLSPNATDLTTSLEYLAGLTEVHLKAAWRKEAFLADIDAPELQALSNQSVQSPADLPAAESVSLLVERLINERRAWYIGQICNPLQVSAVSMTLASLSPTRIVFDAAFLVGSDDQEEFYRYVEHRTRSYEDRLEFHYDGPWPPHHFGLVHSSGVDQP